MAKNSEGKYFSYPRVQLQTEIAMSLINQANGEKY